MTMSDDRITITNRFPWKRFSVFEVIKYKIQTLLLRLLCFIFDSHSWSIEPTEWTFSEIETMQHYRKHMANKLSCDFCGKNCSFFEVADQLSANEISIYNYQVSIAYSLFKSRLLNRS